MSFSLLRLIMVMLSLSVLTACSPPWIKPEPVIDTLADWYERQLMLADRAEWKAAGRVAMQSKNDAWSASISWQQIGERYQIKLYGPLGGRALEVEGASDYVTLTTSDGERFSEVNAQRLIERQTGWQMPVAGLRYWVLGLVQPRQSAEQIFDDTGRLAELRQSGWHIRYQGYQQVDGIDMPRKIKLEGPHLKVKLILKNWQFGLSQQAAGS